jgi:hypothetical protein
MWFWLAAVLVVVRVAKLPQVELLAVDLAVPDELNNL